MSKVAAVKASAVKAKNKVQREANENKTKLLSEVKHYGRQIWLAGLGVYFKAGHEGVEYLKELVKAGEGVEKQGKALVAEQVEAAGEELDAVRQNLSSVKGKVELQFDKIEQAFDSRVARGLNRIGIPSRQDLDTLSAKLDVLNAMLERVAKTQ
ncbi:MAG: phasin family protein [Pseudomonas sp.]|uniref:phasin family protein n=1 Tax=Pseudomonas sp. TaxID=306 RepID=UPI0033971664